MLPHREHNIMCIKNKQVELWINMTLTSFLRSIATRNRSLLLISNNQAVFVFLKVWNIDMLVAGVEIGSNVVHDVEHLFV